MITQCLKCRNYVVENTPGHCSECSPLREPVRCGNDCDRPATVVTRPNDYIFCGPCFEGFTLGRFCPDEVSQVVDEPE